MNKLKDTEIESLFAWIEDLFSNALKLDREIKKNAIDLLPIVEEYLRNWIEPFKR